MISKECNESYLKKRHSWFEYEKVTSVCEAYLCFCFVNNLKQMYSAVNTQLSSMGHLDVDLCSYLGSWVFISERIPMRLRRKKLEDENKYVQKQ